MQRLLFLLLKIANPAFPTDSRLYRFWWHWAAVFGAIVIGFFALFLVGVGLIGIWFVVGFGADYSFAMGEFGPMILKAVLVGIVLPSVVYRFWLMTQTRK